MAASQWLPNVQLPGNPAVAEATQGAQVSSTPLILSTQSEWILINNHSYGINSTFLVAVRLDLVRGRA